MFERLIYGTVIVIFGFFAVFMIGFRIVDGSYEEAGARLDAFMGVASEEGGEAAREIADDTGTLLEDIADGPDDKN